MAKLLFGETARRAGVTEWQLRSAIKRGFVKEPPRAGRLRVFDPGELETIKAGLRAAGSLKDTAGQPAA